MNWLPTTIGEVCMPTSQRDPARNGAGSFRYIDISGIDREAKTIARADSVPCAEAPSRARKLVRAGDVLVSTVRPNLNAVAIVPEELDGEIASTGFCVLRANPDLAMPRYLFYRAQHQEFVDYLVANATGASYPAVTDGVVRRAQLPLPSTREQARIVELLDEADRLRRLRREADAKAARILPALFLKMFGDPATNPMGWPIASFANTFDDTTAGNEKLQSSQFLEAGKIAVVDQGQSQIAGYSDDISIAYRGKLPVIVFGDHTRIFKVIDHPFVLGADGVRVLTPKPKVNPLFAYWHCKLLNIPSAAYSRHFKYLKEKNFICPDEALQNRFSELTQTVMSQTSVLEKAAAKVEQIFSVLLDNAFSGQLTAKWRQTHMKELLVEMEQQARLLKLPLPRELEAVR